MSAPLLITASSLLFALMGVGVKFASVQYSVGEMVFYRSLVGLVAIGGLAALRRGPSLATPRWSMHLWRSVSGIAALLLWFYSIGNLPLATAMTLNYMSSVWMALFLIGGGVLMGAARIDARLVAAVLAGFGGVVLILQPTVERQQLWHGLAGLLSGVLAALAYLQVTALGRAGEPAQRIVFYFCAGGVSVGAAWMAAFGAAAHTPRGLATLLAIGLLATLAQTMMTRAYRIGSPLVNASLQYLGIVFSFAFGVLLFDEALTPAALAGMALIVGAGLVATLLRTRQQPDRPETRAPPTES
jgi:drug/metabolite transporter (DMT)-like permease